MLEIKLIGLTAALVVAITILLNHDISKDYQKKRPPYEKDAIQSVLYVKYGFFLINYNKKVQEYYRPGTIIEDNSVRTGLIQIEESAGTVVVEGRGKFWVFRYRMLELDTIEKTGITDSIEEYIKYCINKNIDEIRGGGLSQSDIDYLLSQLKETQEINKQNKKFKDMLIAIIQCFDGGCFVNLLIVIYEFFFGENSVD